MRVSDALVAGSIPATLTTYRCCENTHSTDNNMMNTIKDLLRQGNLVEANELIANLLNNEEVVNKAMSTIVDDHDFWRYIFSVHEFRVVADGTDMEEIIAPQYVNVFTQSFFETHFHTVEDIVRYSIHGGAHYKCFQLWKQCPVPYNAFTPTYRAWIEDMYGQRFVLATAPTWHNKIPQTADFYFEFQQIEVDDVRRDVVSMLSQKTPVNHPVFKMMHDWLYATDPLKQETFNQYMIMWARLCADPDFKMFLDHAFV